jgi:hypothetical protein
VSRLEAIGLAKVFFDFLSLEHSNNNVHNIRLCRQIVACSSLTVAELAAMDVAQKVCVCGGGAWPGICVQYSVTFRGHHHRYQRMPAM